MLSDTTIIKQKSTLRYRISQKLKKYASKKYRNKKIAEMRSRLKNKDFSIICINCVAGVLYHDLGLEFLTPTINLFFDLEDFIKFVERLDYYLGQHLKIIHVDRFPYPIGLLDDVEIHFMHYKTDEECIEKWNSRKRRINFDNLFIIAAERDGGNRVDEYIERFSKLPYKNKVLFAHKEYPEYPCVTYVPAFRNEFQVGILTGLADFKGTRYFETNFDIMEWLNSGSN